MTFERSENNREIDIDVERARQAHVDEVQRIEREHAAALEQLNEDQERRRQQLRRNPKKLAKWLTRLAQNEY
jgi:Skp family chaperone for outer membrane proteins